MSGYTTSEVARMIGIHANTVRLYEEWGLLPPVLRKENGYRIFTDFHIDQLRFARIAFQIELVQNGIRSRIVETVKASACAAFDKAVKLNEETIAQLRHELMKAEEAAFIASQQLFKVCDQDNTMFRRKEVSELLDISMDTLRNWELNGLLSIKRKQNGYRMYSSGDIRRLKVIRTLRLANYSLQAILHMFNKLTDHQEADIRELLNTPEEESDIVYVCDRLIDALQEADKTARTMREMLIKMKQTYS